MNRPFFHAFSSPWIEVRFVDLCFYRMNMILCRKIDLPWWLFVIHYSHDQFRVACGRSIDGRITDGGLPSQKRTTGDFLNP